MPSQDQIIIDVAETLRPKRPTLTREEMMRLVASLRKPEPPPIPSLHKTPAETALSLIGATGHATAKALSAALDKPATTDTLRDQVAEFAKALLEAPTLRPSEQATLASELERRTGQAEPKLSHLASAVIDVGNLVQPENLVLKAAGLAPVVAGTKALGRGRKVLAAGDEIDDLARQLGVHSGSSIDLADDAGPAVNASGDSAASLEAINRLKAMQAKGESFVVRDRAGRTRPLVGADAVDYRPQRGEQFGILRSDGGFQKLADEHGQIPADVLMMLGGSAAGAAVGAAASDENSLTGALVGGLGGAALGAGVSRFGSKAVANVAQEATDAAPEVSRVAERTPGLGDVDRAVVDGGLFDDPVKMERPKPTITKLDADDDPVHAFIDRHAGLKPADTKEIKDILFESDNYWSQRRMGMTWEQQAKLAEDIDIRIDLPKGTALNVEEMRALRSKAMGVLGKAREIGDELVDVAKLDDVSVAALEQKYGVSGRQALVAVREEEWLKAKAAMQSLMGARSESARTLNSLRDVQRAREMGDYEFITKALKQGASSEEVFGAVQKLDSDVSKYKFLRSLAKPGAQDYWKWYYISNLLSGPLTHARNALGNASNLAIDMVSAPVAAKFQGSSAIGEATAQFPGLWTGVKDGIQKAAFAFKNGFSLDDARTLADKGPEVFGGKLAPNIVGRTLEATDQFFRAVAFQTELSRAAYTQAYKKGLRGQALWDEAARVTSDPDVALIEATKRYADRSVFRQKPGEGTKVIKRAIKVLDDATVKFSDRMSTAAPAVFDNRLARGLIQVPLGTFIAPFVNTPINIWRAGFELTPGGIAKGAMKGGREGAQIAARGALGTSLLSVAAFWAAEGKMTGAAPTDPQERDQFYADGKLPNAVKIGDRWVSYQMLGGPLAAPLSMVANAMDTFKQTGEVRAGEVIARVSNSLLSQSYLSGMLGLIEAVNRAETHGEQWVGRTLTGFVPASGLVRGVRNVADPSLRDPDTAMEHLQSNIPGMSSSLPPRVDYAGQVPQRRGGAIGAFVNPVDSSPSAPDATRQGLVDTGTYYADPGRAAAGFAKRLEAATGGKITLTRQDQARYAQLYGRASAETMKGLLADPQFMSLPIEERAKRIEQAKLQVSRQVQQAFLTKTLQGRAQ